MKRLVIVVLVAALAFGAWWFTRAKNARNGDGSLRFYGNVDIREVALGFRVAGRLATVGRDEGDAVKPGEELARLDQVPYQVELDDAKGRVSSARARLELLKNGMRPEEIAQARAVLSERQVTFANAERLFTRQEELYRNKTISVQERDDAEARFREAEARLKSAQEQLRLLEAGFRKEEIEQAQAELARAEAAVATAQVRLEDTVLKAPSDGVVLTRAQEPGAILPMGATVLTVSLTRPVWVRAYINEPDLGRVKPGAKVRVYTDSRREPYKGQVGFISPRAEFTPKNVETAELRTSLVYRVRVVVEDPDAELRQGMPVTVILEEGR